MFIYHFGSVLAFLLQFFLFFWQIISYYVIYKQYGCFSLVHFAFCLFLFRAVLVFETKFIIYAHKPFVWNALFILITLFFPCSYCCKAVCSDVLVVVVYFYVYHSANLLAFCNRMPKNRRIKWVNKIFCVLCLEYRN